MSPDSVDQWEVGATDGVCVPSLTTKTEHAQRLTTLAAVVPSR
jgi:hypothetical protein